MTTEPVVAMLRAVNLGRTNRVPMAELRALFASLGWTEARTYLQSGNVVFRAEIESPTDRAALASTIERVIAEQFAVEQPVIIRTRTELATLEARNPYLADETDPVKLHVVFLRDRPEPDSVAKMDRRQAPPDRFTIDGSEVFVHDPDGSGRSRLRLDLDSPGTARNWRTVVQLLAMM
jgi:uncharacterized protein (DUF1697 family)